MFKILLFLSALAFSARAPPGFQPARRPRVVSNSFDPDVMFEDEEVTPSSNYTDTFQSCTLTISGSNFSGMQATARPYGGALRVSFSRLAIRRSSFEDCSAGFGGAVHAISSVLTCHKVQFVRCRAQYLAGAIACSRSELFRMADIYAVILQATVFSGCRSLSIAGALSISYAHDVIIESCAFAGCDAGGLAGAASFLCSNVLAFRTLFFNNTAARLSRVDESVMRNAARVNGSVVRGGGAIHFTAYSGDQERAVSLNMVGSDNVTYELGTEGCAFASNAVVAADLAAEHRGFDILLSGSVNYQSAGDRFLNPESIAVQGSGPGNRTGASEAELRFVYYASRFHGDSKFFENFPDIPLPDGVTLRDIEDIYRAFSPPALAPAIIEFAQSTDETGEFTAESAGDTAMSQPSLAYSPMRTPQTNPTMAESASIYKVRFSNGRPPTFAGAVSRRSKGPQFQIYDLMKTKLGSEDEYDRYYRQCVVHVLGTTFTKCTAASGRDSVGGGLHVRESQLLVSNSNFTQCTAGFGGALALLDSSVVVQGATFADCTAAYEGGAVLLTWHDKLPPWVSDAVAQLVETTFLRCLSREIAGGVSIQGYHDVVFDRCNFTACGAGSSGGAVSCLESNLLVFRTHFVHNSCGGHGEGMLAKIAGAGSGGPRWAPRDSHPLSGGGALRFVASTTPDNEVLQLGTEESCFIGNTIINNTVPLHSLDLYLGGNCTYQSYGDRFLNWEVDSIHADAGVAVRTYHTHFFCRSDKFLSAGHLCTIGFYADAYTLHQGAQTLDKAASLTYELGSQAEGEGEGTADASQPDNTPWATRVPPATPVDYVKPTPYTPHTSLPLSPYTLHSPATGTAVFLTTDAFPPTSRLGGSAGALQTRVMTVSKSFAPSWRLVHSRSLLSAALKASTHGPSSVFAGSTILTPSGYWVSPRFTISSALRSAVIVESDAFVRRHFAGTSLLPTVTVTRSGVVKGSGAIVASKNLVTGPITLDVTSAFAATVVFSGSDPWAATGCLSPSASTQVSEQFLGSELLENSTRSSEPGAEIPLATVPETVAATAPATAPATAERTPAATSGATAGRTPAATLVATALPPASSLPPETAMVTPAATPTLPAGHIISESVSVTVTEVSRTLSQFSVMSEVIVTVSSYSFTGMSYTEIQVDSSIDSSQMKSVTLSQVFNVTMVLTVSTFTMVKSFSAIEIPVYASQSVTFQLVVPEPPPSEGSKGISDALLIGICTGAAVLIALFLGALRLLIRSNDSNLTIQSDEDNLGEVTVTMTETTNLDSTPLDAEVILGEGRHYREFAGSDDDDFRGDGFQEGDIYV
jgi:hypothetical protein